MKNYPNPYKHVEGDKWTGTTRKNACNRETMMKIRAVIIFIIAQVALAKQHASRRSANTEVEDRAIRCDRNTVTSCLSETMIACHRLHRRQLRRPLSLESLWSCAIRRWRWRLENESQVIRLNSRSVLELIVCHNYHEHVAEWTDRNNKKECIWQRDDDED